MPQRIDGILFDLGETLFDFGRVDLERLFLRGTKAAYTYLRRHGQPLPPFPAYHFKQRLAVRLAIVRARLTLREFNATDVIGELGRRQGQHLSRRQIEHLAWLWYQPLSTKATVEPGTAEMLSDFRDAGLKLGVVSNTFVPASALDRHLDREGLLELLPVRVYSCEVKRRKPDKRIFRTALEQTGLTAERTLFVGDSSLADIWGAKRVGMITVLKAPQRRRFHVARPDHVIQSLKQLRGLVAAYNHSEAGN